MYAPCARAMKRGVPPTARNARTGELTPPGITRRARSNRASLLFFSVDMSRVFRGLFVVGGGRGGLALFAFFTRRQRPEEAVGDHVAHAGAEAGVQRLVEEGERFADRRMQLAAGGQQCRQRRRERVARAD